MNPHVLARAAKALKLGGDTHDLDDLLLAVLRGDAKLWEGEDSVVVAQILEFPKRRILEIQIAAGELDEILTMTDSIYEWGRRHGCTHAVFIGRKGWTKPLAAQGWEPTLTQFTKEL